MVASALVTSISYIIVYFIYNYLDGFSFELTKFLQGFSLSLGLSLFIVTLYIGSQIWKSWWSDGEFLFQGHGQTSTENKSNDFITIKNSRESINLGLHEVGLFYQ